jgi:hypothetical protein
MLGGVGVGSGRGDDFCVGVPMVAGVGLASFRALRRRLRPIGPDT